MRDGSALEFKIGKELMVIFKDYSFISDIFEAFSDMDEKEEKLWMKRDCYYNYIS